MRIKVKTVQVLKFVTIREFEGETIYDAIKQAEEAKPILSIVDGDEMDRVDINPECDSGLICTHEDEKLSMHGKGQTWDVFDFNHTGKLQVQRIDEPETIEPHLKKLHSDKEAYPIAKAMGYGIDENGFVTFDPYK